MTITLTPSQERAIEEAIRSGLVRSRNAGERIRDLRKGVSLDRGSMSFRELAHLEHKY